MVFIMLHLRLRSAVIKITTSDNQLDKFGQCEYFPQLLDRS